MNYSRISIFVAVEGVEEVVVVIIVGRMGGGGGEIGGRKRRGLDGVAVCW